MGEESLGVGVGVSEGGGVICDKCDQEFPPGAVKHAYCGACFCRACWEKELPLDCFDCEKPRRTFRSGGRRRPQHRSFCECAVRLAGIARAEGKL